MTVPSPPSVSCYLPVSVDRDDDGALREVFAPTIHAASVWAAEFQHGGPVTGLLSRAMSRCQPRPHTRIGRVTVDFLGAVPMNDVEVTAWIQRPGRRVELLHAELRSGDQNTPIRPVARASAWRLLTSDTSEVTHHSDPVMPAEWETSLGTGPLPALWRTGFVDALDLRFTSPMGIPGAPTTAWMRLTGGLVDQEVPTDFERVMTIVDIANGIGSRLDPTVWTFLNTELTVHLFEKPSGEWIGLEAETSIGSDGIAMSSSVIHSRHGPIGRIVQNVLVERRNNR